MLLHNNLKIKVSDFQLDQLHKLKPRGMTMGRFIRDLIDEKISNETSEAIQNQVIVNDEQNKMTLI